MEEGRCCGGKADQGLGPTPPSLQRAAMEEVVIAGMSGKLPESENLEEFWANLIGGVDMVTDDDRRWKAGEWPPWMPHSTLLLWAQPLSRLRLASSGLNPRPSCRDTGHPGQGCAAGSSWGQHHERVLGGGGGPGAAGQVSRELALGTCLCLSYRRAK